MVPIGETKHCPWKVSECRTAWYAHAVQSTWVLELYPAFSIALVILPLFKTVWKGLLSEIDGASTYSPDVNDSNKGLLIFIGNKQYLLKYYGDKIDNVKF